MRLYFFRIRDRFSALLALQVDWVVCLCTCKTWLCFFVVVKVLSVFYLTNHIALPHPPFIFSSPIRPPSVLLNLYALKWAFIIKFHAPSLLIYRGYIACDFFSFFFFLSENINCIDQKFIYKYTKHTWAKQSQCRIQLLWAYLGETKIHD